MYSFLDNDLYKFLMMQAVYHNYKDVEVKYELIFRNEQQRSSFSPDIKNVFTNDVISYINNTYISNGELEYLKSLNIFSEDFLEFLSTFRFSDYVISIDTEKGFSYSGSWLATILLEVPLMYMLSRIFFIPNTMVLLSGNNRLQEKIKKDINFKFIEMGTRRRADLEIQLSVIDTILNSTIKENFLGTSNLYIARLYGLQAYGSIAHEWYMAHQALSPTPTTRALDVWHREWDGRFKTSLTDTTTTEGFLSIYSKELASKYTTLRHDSGDPFTWANSIIDHCDYLGIQVPDFVFTDGLDFDKCNEINSIYSKITNVTFGIGTYLTNDFSTPATNIVIKMTECNSTPVYKLSDIVQKATCNDFNTLNKLMRLK